MKTKVIKAMSLLLVLAIVLSGVGAVLPETLAGEENSESAASLSFVMTSTSAGAVADNAATLEPATNIATYVYFQLDFVMGGETSAQPGEIEIEIPLSIWRDRDGELTGNINIPLPTTQEGSKLFYYYIDDANECVVITNFAEIAPSYHLTATISYDVLPTDVRNGYTNDAITATASVNPAGESGAEISTSQQSVTMVTKIPEVYSFEKTFIEKYETWQTAWGESEYDSDDYFYVVWQARWFSQSDQYTQPSVLTLYETDGEGNVISRGDAVCSGLGEFVGFINVAGSGDSIASPYVEWNPSSITQEWPSHILGGAVWGMECIITRHPKSSVENGQELILTNEVALVIEGIDDKIPYTYTAAGAYSYLSVSFDYEGDRLSAIKDRGEVSTSSYSYGFPDFILTGKSFNTGEYRLKTTSRQYDATNESTEKTSNILIDDTVFIGETKLVGGVDYTFSSFKLYSAYHTEHSMTYSADGMVLTEEPQETYEPVKVFYTTAGNGEWIEYGEYSWEYGTFTYKGTGQILNNASNAVISLPEGVAGLKFEIVSSNYQVTCSPFVCITLHPTETIVSMANSMVDNNINTLNLTNVLTNYLIDSNGEIADIEFVNDGGAPGSIINTILDEDDLAKYGEVVYHSAYTAMLARISRETRAFKMLNKQTAESAEGREKLSFTLYAAEGIINPSESIEVYKSTGLFREQTDSTFYDLLPQNAVLDMNSIKVYTVRSDTNYGNGSGMLSSFSDADKGVLCSDFTVEAVPNWQNSGRTMLIINVKVSENFFSYSIRNYWSGFIVNYDISMYWYDLEDCGGAIHNSFAYRSNTGGMNSGKTVDAYSWPEAFQSTKQYYYDLNNDGIRDDGNGNTVYAYSNSTISYLSSALIGFTNAVKSHADPTYTNETEVPLSGNYVYRLYFCNDEQYLTKNLVMYDVIENYVDGDWKGVVESVDVSTAIAKGINVKVYYSTQPVSTFSELYEDQFNENLPIRNLADSSIWTLWDGDLSDSEKASITAIAVDMSKKSDGSDYVLSKNEVVTCYINMKAPYDSSLVGGYAMNRAGRSFYTSPAADSSLYSFSAENSIVTRVLLADADISISKSSNPTSGTSAAPQTVAVDGPLNYTITIKNSNLADAIEEIVVQDTIPDGLTVDVAAIAFYFGSNSSSAMLISDSANTRVAMSNTGATYIFTINKLLANETVSLVIPTTVATEDKFINTASITGIGGYEYLKNSDTTYHKTVGAEPEPEYGVTYEYQAKGTSKTLPDALIAKTPETATTYLVDATVSVNDSAASPSVPAIGATHYDAANNGTWTLDSWDKTSDTMTSSGVHFIGYWTFTADAEYGVTYEYQAKGTSKTLPDALIAKTPETATTYLVDATVSVNDSAASPSVPSVGATHYDAANNGTWTLDSWNKTTDTMTADGVHFIGYWTFTEDARYGVTYEYQAKGTSKTLPDALTAKTPETATTYLVDATVSVNDSAASPSVPSIGATHYDAVNNGTWTLDSWDKTTDTMTADGVHFIGYWTFTEDARYGVTYEYQAKGTSKTLPDALTAKTPATATTYLAGATVSVNDSTAFPSVPTIGATHYDAANNGTWTLDSWNKTTDTMTADGVHFVGYWTFAASADPEPTPTPTPTPTPEPIPTPKPTPETTPTPEATPKPSPKPTPEPSYTPVSEPSPEPSATPTPVPSPVSSVEPTPKPGIEPNPVITPELTPALTLRIDDELTPNGYAVYDGDTLIGYVPRQDYTSDIEIYGALIPLSMPPVATIPQTGDRTNVAVLVIVLCVALAALIALLLTGRHKKPGKHLKRRQKKNGVK